MNGFLTAMLAAGLAAALGDATARAAEPLSAHACGAHEIGRGTVSRILDGRTFVLDDGREVRLAAIEVPPTPALHDPDEIFVQGELIADGFARVGDRVTHACAGELLSREKAARKARLGLWADPYYDVVNVETPVDVPAQRGRFALVEGTVTSVRESGATIYVNFGRRRSEERLRSRNETSAHSRRQVLI